MRRFVPCLAAALMLATASTAWAHPDVEEGVQQYYAAELDEALAAFERAEDSSTLTRDERLRMLVYRALVRFAQRDVDAVDRELRTLASLAQDYELPPETPPAVRERWVRARREVREAALRRESPRVETLPSTGPSSDHEETPGGGSAQGTAVDVGPDARSRAMLWIVGGIGVVAAAAIIGVVVARTGGDPQDTRVLGPDLSEPGM